MQLSNIILITVILLVNLLKLRNSDCAPTRPDDDERQANGNFSTLRRPSRASAGPWSNSSSIRPRQSTTSSTTTTTTSDYWDHRHVFADGVKRALDECREKFKWDRWNCPKKVFQSILDGPESAGPTAKARSLADNDNESENDNENDNDLDTDPVPSNKELGLTRALMASSIVLSTIRSCSQGTSSNKHCHCALAPPKPSAPEDNYELNRITRRSGESITAPTSTTTTTGVQVQPIEQITPFDSSADNLRATTGCDEAVRFGFKIARFYLDNLDGLQSEAGRLINGHNYRVGLQAVRKTMKRRCKCLWPSAGPNCPMKSCWTVVPELSQVAEQLKRQYRVAAKVGAHTARETDASHLSKELSSIGPDKLVFADASPDYCYENKQLGIQGTLDRFCSKPKFNGTSSSNNSTLESRYERDSCDRLCTKCGYKIKKVRLNVERQCDCRFVYCCSVECKRCPRVEEAYKCVRHS